VGHYHIEHLTDDIQALIKCWGNERADVVGHDWGGMVGWFLAMRHPDVIRKLVILNAAHPTAYIRELWKGKQLLRSWYVLMFQIPGLAEWMIKANGYRGIIKQFREAGFTDQEIAQYRQAWNQPGAITGGLNYYRAMFRRFVSGSLKRVFKPIEIPTLLIWGEDDPFAVKAVTQGLEKWVNPLRIEQLSGVGHWVQNEAAGKVNELLLSFLQEDGK
jgi:pimeloyl-ACP methyl ester carboxylesterase